MKIVIALILLLIALLVLTRSLFKTEESQAKIIMILGGGFSKTVVNWKNYFLNENGVIKPVKNDVDKKKRQKGILGTSYFTKNPIWSIYSYTIEWSENHYREGQKEKEKEDLDYIDLRPQYFRSEITRTTGAPQERDMVSKQKEASSNRVDVDVSYLVTLRVISPYEFAFDSPKNSYDAVLERLDVVMGKIISQCEFNLLERLQGSKEALWYGLRNPKKIELKKNHPTLSDQEVEEIRNGNTGFSGEEIERFKLKQEYPELEEEEIEKMKKLWKNYARDISNSEQVETVFEGLRKEDLITESFPGWGIKIIKEGVEIKEVQPPESIKERRKELAEKDMEMERKKRERDMEEIEAEMNEIRAEGKSKAMKIKMNVISYLSEEIGDKEIAEKAFHTLIAADENSYEKRIIEGLVSEEGSGLNIPAISFMLEAGKEMYEKKQKKEMKKEDDGDNDFIITDPRTGEEI